MTDKVIELLQEFADNKDEYDIYKVAEELRELVGEELGVKKPTALYLDNIIKELKEFGREGTHD